MRVQGAGGAARGTDVLRGVGETEARSYSWATSRAAAPRGGAAAEFKAQRVDIQMERADREGCGATERGCGARL